MIVALTGYARSGKDTVGDILVRLHGFRRVAFGDVLKAVAEDTDPVIEVETDGDAFSDGRAYSQRVSSILASCGGWEGAKDACPPLRQYLVDLGNSLRRHVPGIEVDAAFAGIEPGEDVVNTNVYHPEEIDRIRAMGGKVFRVMRPGIGPANADEAATGQHPVNGVIANDGSLDDLAAQIDDLMRHLRATAPVHAEIHVMREG